jgi:hypothetical protein
MAEEEPELLAAAAEGLGRAPEIVIRAVEELGDVEIFLPGLGDGERVAIRFLEGRLLLRVLEEIDAVGVGVDVAVHGLREHAAIPDHERVAIDGLMSSQVSPSCISAGISERKGVKSGDQAGAKVMTSKSSSPATSVVTIFG